MVAISSSGGGKSVLLVPIHSTRAFGDLGGASCMRLITSLNLLPPTPDVSIAFHCGKLSLSVRYPPMIFVIESP
ncbi:hypothetical protein FR483_n646L [Paramecium bursaria Chlorella virus FR483]|uniref:Uncharacterized protein n646L n=1 Tax=Paramecium bursaria Chlorella virus FR483 TaxID=399781 RepID=A7J800_PBCVF|nr:hypothetical protein FR483_n646L [Paramecium bursaria Chlorella virus FR483]ABT15931.1 hypothetical protein FR483_n646L [Paramecium bursaria Chlorella virus FR483]